MSIGEPAAYGHGVLRVKYVGCWRIINDDGLSEVTANLGEILDIVALVIVATFAEETMVDDIVNV